MELEVELLMVGMVKMVGMVLMLEWMMVEFVVELLSELVFLEFAVELILELIFCGGEKNFLWQ